jgi:prepilin-type processing-associated H-X9-DG protein
VVIAIIAILAAILFPVFAQARGSARKASCISNLKQLSLGYLMYMQDYDEKLMMNKLDPVKPFNGPTAWVDSYPTGDCAGWWMGRVQPYIKNYQIMACPSDGRALGQSNAWGQAVLLGHSYLEPGDAKYFKVSYGLNEWLDGVPGGSGNVAAPVDSLAAISYPASMVLFSDAIGQLTNDWDCSGSLPLGGCGVGFSRAWYANTQWGVWANDWQDHRKYDHFARHNEGTAFAYLDGHAKWSKNSSSLVPVVDPNQGNQWNPGPERPWYDPFSTPASQ